VRAWQHVLDPLCGYLRYIEHLAANPDTSETSLNFGPAPEGLCPVGQVVERLSHLWQGRPDCRLEQPDGLSEAGILRLDCRRAETVLGWRPRLGIDAALAWTADWYAAVWAGEEPQTVTWRQLSTYLEGLNG